jgi:hypothetical protein
MNLKDITGYVKARQLEMNRLADADGKVQFADIQDDDLRQLAEKVRAYPDATYAMLESLRSQLQTLDASFASHDRDRDGTLGPHAPSALLKSVLDTVPGSSNAQVSAKLDAMLEVFKVHARLEGSFATADVADPDMRVFARAVARTNDFRFRTEYVRYGDLENAVSSLKTELEATGKPETQKLSPLQLRVMLAAQNKR